MTIISIKNELTLSIQLDAEDIFAEVDSIDAPPRRPTVSYINPIQISDDEMDAVRIFIKFIS